MDAARDLQSSPAMPLPAPPTVAMANGASLVDATYGAPPAGVATPISYNDPDLVNGGRSVTQELLAFPFRGDAMVTAMLNTGVAPAVLARDLRQAGAQGIELLERILAKPASGAAFDLAVLEPFRNIQGFDALRAALVEHRAHPDRTATVRHGGGGDGHEGEGDDGHHGAPTDRKSVV